MPRVRLAEEVSTERSEEGEEQIIVIAPEMTGVIVLRAPIRGPSFAADTVNALQGVDCSPVLEAQIDPATLSEGVGLPEQRNPAPAASGSRKR